MRGLRADPTWPSIFFARWSAFAETTPSSVASLEKRTWRSALVAGIKFRNKRPAWGLETPRGTLKCRERHVGQMRRGHPTVPAPIAYMPPTLKGRAYGELSGRIPGVSTSVIPSAKSYVSLSLVS